MRGELLEVEEGVDARVELDGEEGASAGDGVFDLLGEGKPEVGATLWGLGGEVLDGGCCWGGADREGEASRGFGGLRAMVAAFSAPVSSSRRSFIAEVWESTS